MKNLFASLLLTAVIITLSGCGFSVNFDEDDFEEVVPDDEATEDLEEDEDGDTEEEEVEVEELDLETMIYDYYSALEEGDLEDAYKMKYDPEPTYKTFEGWYGNVETAKVEALHELDNGDYRFTVFLTENNGSESEYRTVMRLTEDLMETVSAYEIVAESLVLKASRNGQEAEVKNDGDKQKIYLNGKVIKELEPETYGDYTFNTVSDLSFSDDAKYLSWRVAGWEGNGVTIYRLDSGIELMLNTPTDWGFESSMYYLYACQESGMHGGYMSIYKLPTMSIHNQLNTYGYTIAGCDGYNNASVSYTYKMVKPLGREVDTFDYSFITNKVELL